jgi:predicted RNA-binding protein with PIN domain
MRLLVDGNNVMGQTPGWHRDRAGARRRLLAEIASYVGATRARATVVFDGAPDPDVPDGSVFRGVRVYYPPRGSDADTLIERLLAGSKDRAGMTVVTSDRRLAAECRALGARVVRSGDFRRRMAEAALRSDAPDPGEADQPAGSVDEWLRYFGCDPDRER